MDVVVAKYRKKVNIKHKIFTYLFIIKEVFIKNSIEIFNTKLVVVCFSKCLVFADNFINNKNYTWKICKKLIHRVATLSSDNRSQKKITGFLKQLIMK